MAQIELTAPYDPYAKGDVRGYALTEYTHVLLNKTIVEG